VSRIPPDGPDALDAPPPARRASGAGAAADRWDRWRRWLTRSGLAGAALLVLTASWWGPPMLSRFDFFHVRRIEFEGVRYSEPPELLARLAVDTLASVWMPLEPLAARLRGHPMVEDVVVSRRLPGTLRVRVAERQPVALRSASEGMLVLAADGATLPIDPTHAPLDVPVVSDADSLLLGLLDRVRQGAPTLWGRLSEARREGPDDVRFVLDGFDVRVRTDVPIARLDDIFPVEADLARRRVRATELDLRFRDQVIARLP
jgi:cell division protein FtsQ